MERSIVSTKIILATLNKLSLHFPNSPQLSNVIVDISPSLASDDSL